MIFTRAFWRAAGLRAGRTVLVTLLPFLAPVITNPSTETVKQAGLALAGAAVFSVATSFASLPELGGGRSKVAAIVDRTVRTFGQTLAAAIGAAALVTDVTWAVVAQALAAAALTAVGAVIDALPEVDETPRLTPPEG